MATSRRGFLAAGLGLAVAGCAARPALPTPEPSSPSAPPPSSPTTTATTPAPPALPSRAAIMARYANPRPQEWGLETTGTIRTTNAAAKAAGFVALTFDACGGPHGAGYDAPLIATLRQHQVPASLLLNARWIEANPALAAQLAADPLFEIHSHGRSHMPLSTTGKSAYGIAGSADVGAVYDEIISANAAITALAGTPPRFFRPGTAFTDEVAAAIARDLGMPVLEFSLNGDGGATFPAATVAGELARLEPGDVVISHMNQPSGGTAAGYAQALPKLLARGLRFGKVSDLCAGM